MHPTWNTTVKFIPKWIAPNLLTFAGFVCMVICVVLLLFYDYHCFAADDKLHDKRMPDYIYTVCAVLLFLAYNLDGIDGKQARRIGVSGPLGELFDHGLDSYIVFLIPFCLFSVFGRDEFSIPVFRGYLIVMSVVLNFYVCQCEKYNTGTLYLPWGYDLSMWVSSIIFLLAGLKGPQYFKVFVFSGVTFVQALEVAVHSTGLFTTLPICIYNVYLSYKNRTGKMRPILEALRPLWSMLIMVSLMTFWAIKSPNGIIEIDLRVFLLLFGTLFSNIANRLIVAGMSGTRCDAVCPLLWPIAIVVALSLYQPQLEIALLYLATVGAILAHVHYGVCVVRQMCGHFKVQCFTVPKSKQK
ncbi:ethanolaminephosphotransferase 1-like isoform X2 [Epargyreus clarus]